MTDNMSKSKCKAKVPKVGKMYINRFSARVPIHRYEKWAVQNMFKAAISNGWGELVCANDADCVIWLTDETNR